MSNYWDDLMGDDQSATDYMATYGEGVGSETRFTIGDFINEGESVLDVGCGPAWNLTHFSKHGPKIRNYFGLDYSERFVRTARVRIEENPPVFKWAITTGDCRALPCLDNSYDVVILQDVLEHTNGFEKPVHEALRVAIKRVIISFWHLDETAGQEHINDDGNDGYGAWYSRPQLETFLNDLRYTWFEMDSSPRANRKHWFYVINKEQEVE